VLGVGIACLDYLFITSRTARGGQARLVDFAVEGGGLVGTAVVAAARLGAEAAIRCWVGDDAAGEQVIAGLGAEGVDTSGVEVVAGARTAVSFVQVEEGTGERTIYYRRGAEPAETRVASLSEMPLDWDVLLVDGVWPKASEVAARRAREAGIPVVGDLCPVGAGAEVARLVTHLIVPQACAERLAPGGRWEEQLRALAEFAPGFVAITAGGEGCWYREGSKRERVAGGIRLPQRGEGGEAVRHQPAFPVEVVDTTGAGDVFHGAFAYGLARGWESARCVEFASAVAALSCRALGGRKGIPGLGEALGLLGGR
jgi:sugar/nucleoside kinase (ribokinase family)